VGARTIPEVRFLSTFEQTTEPRDPRWQYVVLLAPPYAPTAVKVPAAPLDQTQGRTHTLWDSARGLFQFQFQYLPGFPEPAPPTVPPMQLLPPGAPGVPGAQ
jgi:hypothetical protein